MPIQGVLNKFSKYLGLTGQTGAVRDTPKSGGGKKSYNDLDDAFADLMS